MVRKKSDYHILVAQNFLANISIDGTHQDTNVRIFNAKGLPKLPSQKKFSNSTESANTVRNIPSIVSLRTISVGDQTSSSNLQCDNIDEESHHVNFSFDTTRETPPKKHSFFRRIAKIMSSDDVIQSMITSSSRIPLIDEGSVSREEICLLEFRSESPSCSSNQFSFLRRLKSSITHNDRYFLCHTSTGNPVAVFSYIRKDNGFIDNGTSIFSNSIAAKSKKYRSKSIFGSSDRMRHYSHASSDELRPFIFRDSDDSVSLGQVKRTRKLSPFFTLFEKPPAAIGRRRDSLKAAEPTEDFFGESIDIAQSSIRESSYERGHSLDEKIEIEVPKVIEMDTVNGEYDPSVFNELATGKRTVMRHPGFVACTVHNISLDKAKASMNEDFEMKFPTIRLTLSKLMSIKREMLKLAKDNCIDFQTLAVSYVYFEKIVSSGLISKINRKCVAGISMLVALKMNDYCKLDIKSFIESAEDQLRETKSDLLAYELPLCSALLFKLQPTIEEIQPHLDRLQFDL